MVAAESNKKNIADLFTSRPNTSPVDFVVNSIKELLLTQQIGPGDRLPTEIELTRLLQVSRGSVREAMKILSALGIVKVKRGDGTYIAESVSEAMLDPLLFSLIISRPEFAELKELRRILETNVVRLAVQNATEEDLCALSACLEKTTALKDKKEKIYEELLDCDIEFHRLLGKATKNRPLETVYRFVMQYFKTYIAHSLHKHSYFGKESAEAHRKIFLAVQARDVKTAIHAVEESMEVWESLIQQD